MRANPFICSLTAMALCVSSTAAAASTPGVSARVAAMCSAGGAATGAAVAASQGPVRPGCVLPAVDQTNAVAAPVVESGKSFSAWPLLLGLAAVIALGYFLLKGDDDDDGDFSAG